MTEQTHQEYDADLIALLEALWGEGFMSPGGVDEVDRYLRDLRLDGLGVLDIGCGLGGVAVHLIKRHRAARVTGIDIGADLIERCNRLARKYGLSAQVDFICVDPGPLPFADASFDLVTSKDSIIHIADKAALLADVFRLLTPDGWFAASDWLAGYEGEPSAAMRAYLEAEGLDFGLASADAYRTAMAAAGFVDIATVDRNDWYRQQAHAEREHLAGVLYPALSSQLGREFVEHEIDVWDKMIIALNQGQLRPTHLRCRKPA